MILNNTSSSTGNREKNAYRVLKALLKGDTYHGLLNTIAVNQQPTVLTDEYFEKEAEGSMSCEAYGWQSESMNPVNPG